MNESITSPINSLFAVKEINPIQFGSFPPNIYQHYVYGNTPFEIPQFYSGDEVIRYMVPESFDNRFLILCPNNGNINFSKITGRGVDSCTQTAYIQTDIQAADLEDSAQAPSETTKNQHPGFILLSVKHEKIREVQPVTRKVSNGHKSTGVPTRKLSRKRLRKLTPNAINSGALLVDGVGFLSVDDASKLTSNIAEKSPSFSRFRVTRIADASSWWIPKNSSMNISVHDLKTSSLPDFVSKQYEKMQSSVSYTSQDRTKWNRDIRKYMDTNLLTEISEDTPM